MKRLHVAAFVQKLALICDEEFLICSKEGVQLQLNEGLYLI